MEKRREFIKKSILISAGLVIGSRELRSGSYARKSLMKPGLVTYLWGKDWDLPSLISNCEKTGFRGVELRTEHAHGVETTLNAAERKKVKKMFTESRVTCVGYGSNFQYHDTDPAKLKWNIEQTKAYIKLCHDIGATGIKVKPNNLPSSIPAENTIAQIADSLNEVGRFASDYGQLVRVEVHGKHTQELPNMKAIFDLITEKNVKICWNCNPTDLNPPGLKHNFNLVKKWIGDTIHVREMNSGDYPYQELINLLASINYNGWILLEARTDPEDKITALREQMEIFSDLTANIK